MSKVKQQKVKKIKFKNQQNSYKINGFMITMTGEPLYGDILEIKQKGFQMVVNITHWQDQNNHPSRISPPATTKSSTKMATGRDSKVGWDAEDCLYT